MNRAYKDRKLNLTQKLNIFNGHEKVYRKLVKQGQLDALSYWYILDELVSDLDVMDYITINVVDSKITFTFPFFKHVFLVEFERYYPVSIVKDIPPVETRLGGKPILFKIKR